jgi:hypothetical protein
LFLRVPGEALLDARTAVGIQLLMKIERDVAGGDLDHEFRRAVDVDILVDPGLPPDSIMSSASGWGRLSASKLTVELAAA